MKREELKAQGLTDEQIEFVMTSHGKTVQTYKDAASAKTTEIESYKTQVAEANKAMEDLKKGNKDVEAVQKAADDWKAKYEAAEADRVKAVQDGLLDVALAGVGAQDPQILKAQIDMDALSFKDGQVHGLDKQIETLRTNKGFLFVESKPTDPRFEPHLPPKSTGEPASDLAKQLDEVFKI